MKEFFDAVRKSFGKLSASQVEGFNVLLDATNGLPIEHQAYVLATAWHETAMTMQPIHERGKRSYFDKYEPHTKIGRRLGNTLPGDGFKFRGRGYVQITGRANYAKASKICGVDMVANPELALDAAHAAKIIVSGMREGWFTRKKMADYKSFKSMRRVVNGTDKDDEIAAYANDFLGALMAARINAPAPKPVTPSKPQNVNPGPSVGQEKPGNGVGAETGVAGATGFAAWLASLMDWPWETIGAVIGAGLALVILIALLKRRK